MIAVQDLTKEYGAVRALDGLSFSVNEGEILGFLGPNGAGKTTAMRMLAGYVPPTSGGAAVARGRRRRRAPAVSVNRRVRRLPSRRRHRRAPTRPIKRTGGITMASRSLIVETITPESFAPYGTVIDWNAELEASGHPFHILMRSEEPTGWRLAILKVVTRSVGRMENHPDTEELFAPVSGASIILVARAGDAECTAFRDESGVKAFLLDRPVSLWRGVWHGNLTLSEQCTILIAENLDVSTEYASLGTPITATLS